MSAEWVTQHRTWHDSHGSCYQYLLSMPEAQMLLIFLYTTQTKSPMCRNSGWPIVGVAHALLLLIHRHDYAAYHSLMQGFCTLLVGTALLAASLLLCSVLHVQDLLSQQVCR